MGLTASNQQSEYFEYWNQIQYTIFYFYCDNEMTRIVMVLLRKSALP